MSSITQSIPAPSHSVWQTLRQRGFFQHCTDEAALETHTATATEPLTAYIGFDPTADSFHAGHLIPLMALMHFQRAGHRPIALLGCGTAMIGDPTGKNTMRKMLSADQLQANAASLHTQLARLLDFRGEHGAILANNADWLLGLGYVDFLREVGVHFSVGRMLTFETFRTRLQGSGLSFLEFNYPLLQAYDFLQLQQRHNCIAQLGGDDQWANILGGVELVRRVARTRVYGWTLPLLTTAAGAKMGKTERGALWLDAAKTSPYAYYQYWLNIADADVGTCLRLLTFLPLEEVAALARLQGEQSRQAKAVLAREACTLVHGAEEAARAQKGARALFGGAASELAHAPAAELPRDDLQQGLGLLAALEQVGLTRSRSEARRLVRQGGISVNGVVVQHEEAQLTLADLQEGAILLGVGKKRRLRITLGKPRPPATTIQQTPAAR